MLISLPIASTTSGAATANPIRQPLMLYDLLKVYAATRCSSIPGSARIDACRAAPDHVAVWLVRKDHQLGAAHDLGDFGQIVARRHAARWVVRRVEDDRPRLGIAREEPSDILGRRAKLVFDLQVAPARPRALDARDWEHMSETGG